jgi:heme exporter protein A
MKMTLLRCDRLHLWRGDKHVLRGLSFAIAAGECLLVTGSNGAGKTTLLRAVAGLLEPEEGDVSWRGTAMAYLGHDAPLKADLTGAENLRYAVGVRRTVIESELRAALADTGATKFADRPVRTLSAGQRRRVALAGLILIGAELWVLDEPTTNLDTEGQGLISQLLTRHLERGGVAMAAIHQAIELDPQRVRRLELGMP